MKAFIYLVILTLPFQLLNAQALRPSGEIIEEGIELYEEESYESALEKFEQIHENDTNYAVALVEMSLTYMAMEEYEKAIEVCDKALGLPYEIRPNIYVNKGNSLDELERREEAIEVFEEGIQLFPRYASLYYNKAVTLGRMEKFQEALDVYYQTLEINPLHAGTHGRIGALALGEGEYTLGLLAINTFLMIEPHTNRSLAYLGVCDEYMAGAVEPDPKGLPKELKGLFNAIDIIIKNKVALNPKYKVKKPKKLDFPFVKQNHAMLSKLTYRSRESNRWYQMYVPFWKKVWDDGMFESFVYTALVSVPDDEVQKLLNKNSGDIKEFITWSKRNWIEQNKELEAEIMGETMTLPAYYYNDNSVQAIGKQNAQGDLVGPWVFYNVDGYKLSEGEFNGRGEQTGTWTWFNPDGSVNYQLTFERGELDGPYVYFYRNGNKMKEGAYKDGERHGTMKEYTYSGALEAKSNYDNGELDGEQTTYYINKQVTTRFNTKDGKVHGEGTRYYDSGELFSTMTFKDNNREGEVIELFRDGSTSLEENYVAGKLHGPFKSYYRNGQLREDGTAEEGTPVGLQTEYYVFGSKSDETEFDESGKLNGITRRYDWDGKLHYEWEYRKGEIVGYLYYDKDGKIIHEDKRSFNRFEFKGYTPDGILDFEGTYKASEKDGTWKYYDRYGNLISQETYDNGVTYGTSKEYFRNGVLRSETVYKDGDPHGRYREFFSNDQLAIKGHFENGYRSGPWISYRPDGTLESELYYRQGSLDGWQRYYDVEGRIRYMNYFDKYIFNGTVYFDSLGQERERVMLENGTGTFISHHPNGKESLRMEYLHGEANGDAIWKNVLGQVELQGKYFNGKRVGKWEWFWDGKQRTVGYYYHGKYDSVWTDYYPDGSVSEVTHYEYGILSGENTGYHKEGTISATEEYKNDLIHGPRKFYNPKGELTMVRYYYKGKIIGYSYAGTDGELVEMIPITGGTATVTTYYPNGQKALEYGLKNGYFEGSYKKYYSDGTLWEDMTYKDDDRTGTSYKYYPDGTKKEERNSYYNSTNGKLITYYPNGKTEEVRDYKMGDLHGKRVKYDKTGKVILEQMWYDGKLLSQSIPQ